MVRLSWFVPKFSPELLTLEGEDCCNEFCIHNGSNYFKFLLNGSSTTVLVLKTTN